MVLYDNKRFAINSWNNMINIINVNEYKKQDKEIFQIQIGYMKFEC